MTINFSVGIKTMLIIGILKKMATNVIIVECSNVYHYVHLALSPPCWIGLLRGGC